MPNLHNEDHLFSESEIKGRRLFKTFLYNNAKEVRTYKESLSPSDSWDVAFETESGKKVVGEIKFRNAKHNSFSTLILEEYKLQQLQIIKELEKEIGIDVTLIYINLFTDSKITIWELNRETLKDLLPHPEILKKATVVDRGLTSKDVIQLPSSRGFTFNYEYKNN